MNLLVQTSFPESLLVDGKDYLIRADFRSCLTIMLAFEDDSLTQQEKQSILLQVLYPAVPDDALEALQQAQWFLNGGKESKNEDKESSLRVYSFTKDAEFIFAAFRQTHGIDLSTADLHWWQFLALFMDLGADTTFCALIGLRKRVKTGRATKEERQAARELGDVFDVPEVDVRSLDEKDMEAEFMRLVQLGKKTE
ncbi:MAG: Gp15 family bacteriophage protein [Anaerolineales bacterium]|nr:Gp15 family bacteriophage protein [Anaerolineales bacterium]